ncbi:DNA recombination protein RmuC [Salinarimonas ramus]|uniref:DNA recombination protein RmuC homolog n=1 Tax=Salinarimonas ramus TaxID=690164 RepID=A0A917V5J8_9HYPH|nr:DNA recombination protein RmuC [Salinarimonas ramus]GGK42987.1 DNA recombinase [Salinarimonas ramus]
MEASADTLLARLAALDPAAVAVAAGAFALVCLLYLVAATRRLRRERDDLARTMAEIAKRQAEMTGRMTSFTEVFGSRQGDFARMLAERIERGTAAQNESLSKLNARLAVIDAAQKNIGLLTQQVTSLEKVLANKQARGAWGQGRMEAIVRDGLPADAFAFQATLSSGARPDCLVRLPGDARGLVIDAKFPLESFASFRDAPSAEARARAAQRVRADVARHVQDIAGKYLIPGETQDVALMFVPAESLYADLQEHFGEVVERAHRARVVIVSPALLALAIQVVQALARDARVREEARVIQTEVARLVADVSRLDERVAKLDQHFRQAQDDVAGIRTSTEKIRRRGRRIEALDFDDGAGEGDLFERAG